MTSKFPPVIIISQGGYEPNKALFVNGLYICGMWCSESYIDAEVIEIRAQIIADAIGCQVLEIDTAIKIDGVELNNTYIQYPDDWRIVYEELASKFYMPEYPEVVKNRLKSVFQLNIYS